MANLLLAVAAASGVALEHFADSSGALPLE
jgi:hypothetical protein